jgi:2-polyprenyl-3-methyl-5-hydroxy-6-metoxy-1,4-benzoquinol methylase
MGDGGQVLRRKAGLSPSDEAQPGQASINLPPPVHKGSRLRSAARRVTAMEKREAMTATNSRASLADTFDRSHPARLNSATLERIHRAAFGDDYPEEANPNAFFSCTTLRRVAASLGLAPGRIMVDLGCGHGGLGLWIARQSGANVIGIDLSPVGVALAQERAAAIGMGDRSRFHVGDLTATSLLDGSCDAAMSLDVLLFVPDQAAALREVARILRADGLFAFTTWEQSGYSARLGALQVADYRPLLDAAGFAAEVYEEPMDWRRHQRALAEGLIAAETELADEFGMATAARYLAVARGMLADLPVRRYVFVLARRR